MAVEQDHVAFVLKRLTTFHKDSAKFVRNDDKLNQTLRKDLKKLYEGSKLGERHTELVDLESLPQLHADHHFDDEQIWQQVELQNHGFVEFAVKQIAKISSLRDTCSFGIASADVDDDDDDLSGASSEEVSASGDNDDNDNLSVSADDGVEATDGSESSTNSADEEALTISKIEKVARKKAKDSVVDDEFFKLAEMEEFLELEDRKFELIGSRKNAEDVDSEDDEEDEDDDDTNDETQADYKYSDFFTNTDSTAPQSKDSTNYVRSNKADLSSDDSDGEDIQDILGGKKKTDSKKTGKSALEKRNEQMKQKIKEMEESNMADKPWQMKGEVSANLRKEDSVLEENLDFDYTAVTAPDITEETTLALEDLIKQRIKDKAFDDVERKEKPKEDPFEFKQRIQLNSEKSKVSLSQVYEEEFMKKAEGKEEEDREDPKHEEITKSMDALFKKLDALSNFHFTPKEVSAELTIVKNVAAVTVEEVAPVTASDASLLAPEEVKKRVAGIKGLTERESTDKKREVRKKKKKKRIQQKEREKRDAAKEKAGEGGKQSQLRAYKSLEKDAKSGKKVSIVQGSSKKKDHSSKKFFTKLQEEVTSHINSKKRKNTVAEDTTLKGKKLKL